MTPIQRYRELKTLQQGYINYIYPGLDANMKAKLYEEIDNIYQEINHIDKMPYWELWDVIVSEPLIKESRL